MPRISSATSPDTLRKEAKRWLKALRAQDAEARARFERASPGGPAAPGLRHVQHALAREYGHESWLALQQAVATTNAPPREDEERPLLAVDAYEALAQDYVHAFNDRDAAALDRLNRHYRRTFAFDDLWAEVWRRMYSFRQRAFGGTAASLELDE